MKNKYARIIGSGAALPSQVVTNEDLTKRVETSDEWIFTRTGIRQRHIISGDESNASLAFEAANQALKNSGIAAGDLDLIICATCTPDKYMPSSASYLQERLGACAVAFDLNAACSGFVYALNMVNLMIKSGQFKRVLVVGVDVCSRLLDWEDRTTCVLFGDGAGAVVFAADSEPGILGVNLNSEKANPAILNVSDPIYSMDPSYLTMSGREVFKKAVNSMDRYAVEILQEHNFAAADVDWLIPHQANWRIIKATLDKLGIDHDHAVVTVDKHANTVAASIPLALNSALVAGKIKSGDLLLFEAFGAGITSGVALCRYI